MTPPNSFAEMGGGTIAFVVKEVKLLQPENALLPILIDDPLRSVMLVKPVQPLNALGPILLTVFGSVILVKLAQLLNAAVSMPITVYVVGPFVTDSDIVIEVGVPV